MYFSAPILYFLFFQAEDGIRDFHVTGVQTCALPILDFYQWFVNVCDTYSITHKYILVSNSTCSSAELFVDKFKHDLDTTIIGSKTYGKEYIYKQIVTPDAKVLVPKLKIETDFTIDIDFDFDYYYPVKRISKRRYYNPPKIMML